MQVQMQERESELGAETTEYDEKDDASCASSDDTLTEGDGRAAADRGAEGEGEGEGETEGGDLPRWPMRSFLSGVSRPDSLQSGVTWDDEMSDYDRQACRRVKMLFGQIDNVLFEHDAMPNGCQQLSDECAEWRRLFPHLRVLGAQLCSSADLGYSFTSQPVDGTPRRDGDGDRDRDGDGPLLLAGATVSFCQPAPSTPDAWQQAEEIIAIEGGYEETLAIDCPSGAGNATQRLADKERPVELLRQAELALPTAALQLGVLRRLFDVAWATLSESMQPLVAACVERRSRATSTKRLRFASQRPDEDEDANKNKDKDRSKRLADTRSAFVGTGEARRERATRRVKSSPWAGVVGVPLGRADSTTRERERAVSDYRQEAAELDAVMAEPSFVNFSKPLRMAGRLHLARKLLSAQYQVDLAPEVSFVCAPHHNSSRLDKDRDRDRDRTRKAPPARLEPLVKAFDDPSSASTSASGFASSTRRASRQVKTAPSSLAVTAPAGFSSPVRERSAVFKPAGAMSTIEEDVMSMAMHANVQCASRSTDSMDVPSALQLQRNASCLSVSSCTRFGGAPSQAGTATPSPSPWPSASPSNVKGSSNSKSPWVPWTWKAGAAPSASGSPSPSLANTLRLLPASGEVLRLKAQRGVTSASSTTQVQAQAQAQAQAQKQRNSVHPYNTKLYAAAQEVTVFHEYYRRNFGIRGNGVSLNNRAGK